MRAFFNGRGVFLGLLVCLIYSVVLTMGCATTNKNKTGTSGTSQTSKNKLITHVEMSETADETHVLVTGEQNLTFTAVKQPDPPVVIFYFPDTASSVKKTVDLKGSSFITGIDLTELTETGHTVRLKIQTISDAPYSVNRQGNALDIIFKKVAAHSSAVTAKSSGKNSDQSASKKSPVIAANKAGQAKTGVLLKAIEAKSLSDSTQISIRLDGAINQYRSFTLDQPPRIVLDLPKIKSLENNEQNIAVDSQWVKKIRYYSDAQRLRVVLETQKAYLDSFSVIPDANSLLVTVGAATSVERTIIRNIEYQDQAAGGSRVIVLTSRPAQYKMKRISPRWLRLMLLNSRLPQEKILVGNLSEKGVVASIVPGDHASQSSDAYVDLRLKTTVPYLIHQDGDKLYVQFEPLPDRLMADNSSKVISNKVSSTIDSSNVLDKSKTKHNLSQDLAKEIKEPTYTGEKIALDFFNTDIRNVFRILADISGENFAVDKDVKGQVTLSLNKPVPWDRVLDLVLKMNQLEKEKQQGITRIATLATLEAEKKARMAAREATVKEEQARVRYLEAKRQIERLQPLETVYIQVNYADADADIKPQIEPLLSKYKEGNAVIKRGSVSIDKRNNVVIITDVPDVIDRAKETVLKIDKLVPQVLIEARIVEASTDFSREIGLSWGMTTGIQADDPRAGIGPQQGFDLFGGTYGWDTAVNHPFSIGSPMEIGFNIAKIAGSPFGLNARLRALEINGSGKIISSPKVLSRDNQEAVITQGREYPYFEESESGGTTVKFKKVELKLTVLPNITPDDRIAIKLKIEKKDVISFVANVPVLSTREAESDFLMNNGDTLVIGGIHKTTNRLTESGFPWLSKLPLLGWLFKTKNKELDKEELLIFITPKILRLEQRRPVVEKISVPVG